jgi:predicted MFS family arabinose efflux permease
MRANGDCEYLSIKILNMNENTTGDRPISIAVIVFLGAVAVAGFNIQPMYLGALADHLGFTAEQLGFIAGLEIAGSALAGIAATFWIRRWDWRRVALVALSALATGNIASAYVTDFESLAAIRFLTGFFGIGTNYALAIAALSDTHHTERNYSIAVVVQVSVAILGFVMLPSVIATGGTAAVFLPLSAIAIVMLPFLRLLPNGGSKEKAVGTHNVPVSPFAIWLALGCQAIWYLGIGGVWAFVERIGVDAGIDSAGIGNALALGMAVGLVGAFVAAAVADRFGRVGPFAIAMLGQVVAVWLLADLQELNSLVIAICLYNGTWNFALPYIFAMAALADTRGQLVVLMSTAQAVGLTFGVTLAGAMIGRFELVAVTYQGAVVAMAALGIFLALAVMLRGVKHP